MKLVHVARGAGLSGLRGRGGAGVASAPEGRGVGGIDFGWRNPVRGVGGVLDGDDVLWIDWERYLRQTPLH